MVGFSRTRRAHTVLPPGVGDVVITGEFVSIDEGDRTRRMIIGFGAGAAKMKTVVEVYHIAATGPRLLGSRDIKASGGKGPGMALPLIVAGGIMGRPAMAAGVSGTVNILQELGPEGIQGAADRTAGTISKELRNVFRRHRWIT